MLLQQQFGLISCCLGHWEPLELVCRACVYQAGRAQLSPLTSASAALTGSIVDIAFDRSDGTLAVIAGVLTLVG